MADEAPPSPVSLSRPLRCIVKLGGSAVTHKDVLEHINDKDLAAVASQLREVIMHSTARGYTMDWSKQSGIPPTIPADIADQVLSSSAFIVVHGAEGIPSVGISPFSCGWSTCEKKSISESNLLQQSASPCNSLPQVNIMVAVQPRQYGITNASDI
ncbi:isopentenyl phosphate kinase isoform X4 [Nymphaea colorata]|uniref:isopentenyl phosphate kinase isoform X4 n=1 Tax=Nymphaea colorata TaxID=210225 RepID=UPI00214E1758|nr:isopentenyl phosphate kinase isoform X4 [Nymphaea colorata]